MKIFCYFVEPASYTIDLSNNIHSKIGIEFCFIKSNTLVEANIKSKKKFLDKLCIISKIKYLIRVFNNYDLIIVNGYNNYPFILTFIFNLFAIKKKYIAIESDTQLSIPPSPIKRFIKWLYLSLIFKNKFIIGLAAGNYTHKDLFRSYGMNKKRIYLMPLVVNNQRFYRTKLSTSNTFSFIYVGRLTKHKGVEELIQVFNKYFSKLPIFLKIIGSGNQESLLKQKYSSEKILFLGNKSNYEIVEELHNSSCFVCPSIFEPWGLVVNEALSASLPVICTDKVGSSRDLIRSRRTGFICANMKEFGEKMLELYENPNLLNDFSKNAKDLMINHWNYDLYLNCLNELINDIKNECVN